MSKVIILSRVSTEGQDLVQQTQEILNRVYKDGYKEQDVIIIEDKESGIKLKEEERHGLNELKCHIESDKSIKTIYIYELSRLSRRQKDLFSLRDYLIERKVQLICLKPDFELLDENGKMSSMSSLVFSVFSSLSESEMEIKKERLLRGRKYNLLNGKSGGGTPPFGYTTDRNKRYILHPEKSKILKRIFHEYTNTNKSLRTIGVDLKEEGYFPNTSINTLYSEIQRWTKNRIYLGNPTFPQIISQKEFDLCQKSRVRHVHKSKSSERYLLKGLIYDIDFKSMMYSSQCKHGEKIIEQYISLEKKGLKLRGHSISKEKIEPLIWTESKKLFKRYFINKNKHIKQMKDLLQVTKKKMETFKRDIDKIQEQIDNVEERLIFGKISESRCEKITNKLMLDKESKHQRLKELTEEYMYKQHQIEETNINNEFDFESLSISEKIDIINKVIEVITFKRINRSKSIISIINKYNKKIKIYQINTYGNNTWRKIDERLIKPDDLPNDLRSIYTL